MWGTRVQYRWTNNREIYKELHYSNQKYKENCRPIIHKCRQEREKLKCINMIEVINQEKTEFKDKEGHLYPDVERFRREDTPQNE